MRDYELMTIHRPELAEDEIAAKISDLETHLSGHGATVDGRDLWGKRRFAFEIDHLTEGYYTVVTFKAEADAVDAVDHMLSLNDDVLRHKIVKRHG
jgi:small subunit ribosomal protein S6